MVTPDPQQDIARCLVNDRGPVRDVDYGGMLDYGGRDVDYDGMKQPFCFETLGDIVNR